MSELWSQNLASASGGWPVLSRKLNAVAFAAYLI